ncbi:hypothetical protein [Campylobacter fetus]|uniref:hypothetical protein n=1 Tax=Campylobacter fetus TaxID=196 RepID=UPI00138E4B11|nr:hypothetical protein [Campylobacter fetus]
MKKIGLGLVIIFGFIFGGDLEDGAIAYENKDYIKAAFFLKKFAILEIIGVVLNLHIYIQKVWV